MFPFPDDATKKALDLGRREVFQTYRVLMACELQRLRTKVDELPAGSARDELTVRLDTVAILADGGWVNNRTVRGDTVEQAAKHLHAVQDHFDATTVAPVAPTAVGNRYLLAAVNQLQSQIIDVMNDASKPAHAAVNTAFARLFGSVATVAKSRFGQTVTALQAILARTDGRGSGFVYNPSLPDGMAALASGQGPTAIINVGRSALDGTLPLAELAATIAHEGTHTLATDSTVDIVYRHRNAPYYLQGQVALQNAANYEQTVYEVLNSGGPFPSDIQVAAWRGRTASRIDLLRTVLTSRITRAWVRTYDFTCLDYSMVDVPKPVAVVLTDLTQDRADAPLIKAYMGALHAAMLSLMRADQQLVVKDVPNLQEKSTVYNIDGTIRLSINSGLAATAPVPQILGWMLDELVERAKCQIPRNNAQLLRLILEIENLDRTVLHTVLDDFYSSVT